MAASSLRTSATSCPSRSQRPGSRIASKNRWPARRSLYRDLSADLPASVPRTRLTLAHRLRYVLDMNAREAMHLIELRSGTQGHPVYRRIAQEMHRLIAEQAGHRILADAMTFVDHTVPDLERLEAERRVRARGESELQEPGLSQSRTAA